MTVIRSGHDTLAFECHGTAVRVRSGDEEVLAHLLARLPPGVRPSTVARPDVSYRLWRQGACEGNGLAYVVSLRHGAERERHDIADLHGPDALAILLADDVQFRVALHSPHLLFVHAAAVAWNDRVIAIPGRTFAGKSTLAAELVRAGATYYSDEYLVLDGAGLVHPFARPLHLRGRDGLPGRDVHPGELGGIVGSEPRPLGLVVDTAYRAGARWRPRPMTPGEVALALLANTVAARSRPMHATRLIARAVERGAAGVSGPRGEAAEMVGSLLDLVSVRDASPPTG